MISCHLASALSLSGENFVPQKIYNGTSINIAQDSVRNSYPTDSAAILQGSKTFQAFPPDHIYMDGAAVLSRSVRVLHEHHHYSAPVYFNGITTGYRYPVLICNNWRQAIPG